MEAAQILETKGISAGVINARFAKPLPEKSLVESINFPKIVTVEDNVVIGGFGQSLRCLLQNNKHGEPILNLGWPDIFIEQGTQNELYEKYQLDGKGMAERIEKFVKG
jgi:1-deoxy-D-xylulose-5-phosphate synthase